MAASTRSSSAERRRSSSRSASILATSQSWSSASGSPRQSARASVTTCSSPLGLLVREQRPSPLEPALEPMGVDLVPWDDEPVPRRRRLDGAGAEGLAQPDDAPWTILSQEDGGADPQITCASWSSVRWTPGCTARAASTTRSRGVKASAFSSTVTGPRTAMPTLRESTWPPDRQPDIYRIDTGLTPGRYRPGASSEQADGPGRSTTRERTRPMVHHRTTVASWSPCWPRPPDRCGGRAGVRSGTRPFRHRRDLLRRRRHL